MAECLIVHEGIAFLFVHDLESGVRHIIASVDTGTAYCMCNGFNITGPWIEPLAIKWECLAPECDHIHIEDEAVIVCYGDKKFSNWFKGEAADFYVFGWRDHIGETHYRDGRVEGKE